MTVCVRVEMKKKGYHRITGGREKNVDTNTNNIDCNLLVSWMLAIQNKIVELCRTLYCRLLLIDIFETKKERQLRFLNQR